MRAALLSLALALPLPFLPALTGAPTQEPGVRAGQDPKRDPGQDPGQDPAKKKPLPGDEGAEEARDIFGRPVRAKQKGTVHERIAGCWLLVDIQLNGYPDLGREGSGLMLVHQDHLALELHLSWPEAGSIPDLHQSFIAEYTLKYDTVMRVNTLIGSFIDDQSGDLEWERSGFAREYELTVTDQNLVLTFGEGNRMSFVRHRASAAKDRDIFGREAKESTESRDIYGRPRRRAADEGAQAPRGEAPRGEAGGGQRAGGTGGGE